MYIMYKRNARNANRKVTMTSGVHLTETLEEPIKMLWELFI